MLKFWDNYESFSDQEVSLLNALYDSHQECTYRKNCSTQALTASATGSQCLTQSIAAALMTIGKVHGPVEETYNFLQRGVSNDTLLPPRVPGFGNGFIKGKPDPGLKSVHDFLTEHYPNYVVLLSQIQTRLVAERGKTLFPNPAAYTAIVALIVGMPAHLSPLLFMRSRLEAWAHLFHVAVTQKPEKEET
jgi:citrate synthase